MRSRSANSGHPGMPMGMADVATVLFTRYLKFDPTEPRWPDRDRFVLSAGHGSMLLYSAALPPRLRGHDASTRSENFRQLGSKTPGHPENFGHRRASRPPPARSARGSATPSAWRSPSACSPPASATTSSTTTPMCIASRRRPDGGHQPRGDLDRRPSEAQQADRASSTTTASRSTGRCRSPNSADQVARFEAAGWNASRIDGHDPGRDRRGDRGGAEERPADADRLPDHHRLRRADQGRHGVRRTARRSAPRRSPARARRSAGTYPPFEVPGRHPRRLARSPACKLGQLRKEWEKRLAAVDRETARRVRAPHPRRAAAAASTRRSPTTSGSSPPTSPKVATRKSSEMALDVINAGGAGDDRRLGRPDRLEQHQDQGHEGRHADRLRRPLHPLRHARARHGARR